MRSCILGLFVFICVVAAVSDDKLFEPYGSPIRKEAAADVVAFWTSERMKSAIPLDNDRDFNVSEVQEMMEKIDPKAKPGYTEGFNPMESVDESMNITSIQACSWNTGYAPSYSSYPWITVGKVFFQQGGTSYVCSGAAVNNYGIVTAGHCVYSLSLRQWSTNFVFIPAYNNGNAPLGSFSYWQMWVLTSYITTGSWCYDYAFVSTCGTIGQSVGWLGMTWNAGRSVEWRSLGYPQASPFNGLWNYWCVSTICSQETCTQGIRCDTTGGASGGPWVVGWQSTNYVNSVNSFKYTNDPNSIYGPYFDGNVINVYNSAFGSPPGC